LHQRFVADFALARADHVPFIEDDQTDIIDQDGSLRRAKSSFSGVAMTISRERRASSSPAERPLAP
jgi:hypothetical protein